MSRARFLVALCLAVSTAVAVRPAFSVESPFEPGLMRLAEVLGSLHFLRNLCGEKGDQWRGEMEKLLESENPDPERRARFIASFNRGYRSFGGTYTQCTASATEAISRYMKQFGAYIFYRVGITPAGQWTFFVAGD